MITKILLTIAVIAGLVMYLRRRSRPAEPRPTRPATPAPSDPIIPRSILYLFIGIMLLASAVIFYIDWQRNYRVVTVRVINTQNDHVTEYQVRRKEIDGRRFETLEGKLVILADVERMEIDVAGE